MANLAWCWMWLSTAEQDLRGELPASSAGNQTATTHFQFNSDNGGSGAPCLFLQRNGETRFKGLEFVSSPVPVSLFV